MPIQCPHCHKVFELTDNEYLQLLNQVKTEEFDSELNRRVETMKRQQEAEEKARQLEAEKEMQAGISAKELEISKLRQEIEALKGAVSNNDALRDAALATERAEAQKKIGELASKKDAEIADLRRLLETSDSRHELDLEKERSRSRDLLNENERRISELSGKLEAKELEAGKRELELKEQHAAVLKAKDEEIERYRDLKSRLSTKMLGETLEQHCFNSFYQARNFGAFADATLEKDNDVVEGTKGDFVFRDYINGTECVSIMFEMKNEDENTRSKHRNEDFFAKLDKDRTRKKCEYAVLVSTLEADSELYNQGIVDVSYRYAKMYVIRPQFFLPVISLISKTSRAQASTMIELRRDLAVAQAQSVDVTNFEERRNRFASEFMKFVNDHKKKHESALESIDKAISAAEKQIENLQKVKKLFETSNQKLVRAGDAIENDFTIKKLTRGNPTMKRMFAEERLRKEETQARTTTGDSEAPPE